jgi:hypothetical protein
MGVVELSRLHSGRACRTRNLANAFLGETTRLLKAVEAYEEIDRLKAAAEGKLGRLEDFQVLAPPKFIVYENSIGHRGVFTAPMQHEIVLFYTQLQRLIDHLNAMSALAISPETTKQSAGDALTKITCTIALGEALGRRLRKLVPRSTLAHCGDTLVRRVQ